MKADPRSCRWFSSEDLSSAADQVTVITVKEQDIWEGKDVRSEVASTVVIFRPPHALPCVFLMHPPRSPS